MTKHLYEGTKRLYAQPMTRGQYNAYRGWKLPADESPADEGYLVEYVDGGKLNDVRHTGYISWSPKEVFERNYKPVLRALPVIDPGPDALAREIAAKSTAPRVTPADVEAEIASEHYFTAADGYRFNVLACDVTSEKHQDFVRRIGESMPVRSYGGTCADIDANTDMPASLSHVTICVLILRNGTKIVGVNEGPVSPENFDPEIGRRYAREKAIDQVWPLLGFRLRDKLATQAASVPQPADDFPLLGKPCDLRGEGPCEGCQ